MRSRTMRSPGSCSTDSMRAGRCLRSKVQNIGGVWGFFCLSEIKPRKIR